MAAEFRLWANAFIPLNFEDLTRPWPGHAGKTMIPGPIPIVSDCFLTDQRTFDTSPNASSRMHSMAILIWDGSNFTTSSSVDTHNTIEVDCEDGDIECDKKPDTSDLKVEFQNNPGTSKIRVLFKGGADNPCFAGSPQINWDLRVTVEITDANSCIVILENGSLVELFPSFEMYFSVNGTSHVVIQKSPNPGSGPSDLVGAANEPVSAQKGFTF